ncbi:MAG: flagellar basal body P-ring protein FlgI [Candidatus Margulisiibacteriota bacterium]
MMKKWTCVLIALMVMSQMAVAAPVRIKDIGRIIEARDNQLVGFGLVVGLRNTGDSQRSLFTNKALTNLLKNLGMDIDPKKEFMSRNVAAVMVTADLPPYVKPGQRIAVTVSSVGDSTSLVGGTLLRTPLSGPDGQVYLVAQGSVLVGGVSSSTSKVTFLKNETTVGRIPEGAIVEKTVAITPYDKNFVTLVLDQANFITASNAARALNAAGFSGTKAVDANTIQVPLAGLEGYEWVDVVAQLENTRVIPDASSRIVVNGHTGTVVIGEMVRLSPVAVTHGGISVRISDPQNGQITPFGSQSADAGVSLDAPPNKMILVQADQTLASLVDSINEIGASPKDLISIIQALKESGALMGDLEVL